MCKFRQMGTGLGKITAQLLLPLDVADLLLRSFRWSGAELKPSIQQASLDSVLMRPVLKAVGVRKRRKAQDDLQGYLIRQKKSSALGASDKLWV